MVTVYSKFENFVRLVQDFLYEAIPFGQYAVGCHLIAKLTQAIVPDCKMQLVGVRRPNGQVCPHWICMLGRQIIDLKQFVGRKNTGEIVHRSSQSTMLGYFPRGRKYILKPKASDFRGVNSHGVENRELFLKFKKAGSNLKAGFDKTFNKILSK